MQLSQLPQELLLLIADSLDDPDLNALCQTNRYFHGSFNDYLYLQNVQHRQSDVLQWAALYGRVDTMHIALQNGANIHTTASLEGRMFPNQVASKYGPYSHFALCGRSTHHPIDTPQLWLRCNLATPLVLAAGAGYGDMVVELIQNHAVIDWVGEGGLTPLIAAADGAHTHVIELLLQNGGNAAFRGQPTSWSALEIAAQRGDRIVVEKLLQLGVNPNDLSPCPAIIHATIDGHLDIIQMLLDYGADPQVKNDSDWTAILYAISDDRPDIVRVLLPNLEELLESRDLDGDTFLLHATKLGAVNTCNLLLQLGADPNAPDELERTPLWWAISQQQTNIIDLLLKHGAIENIE